MALQIDPATEVTLGSNPGCQLCLTLDNVAGEHARLAWNAQGLLVRDLNSPTGTFVNGERVSGERGLNDGDRLCLGPPGSGGSAKMLVHAPKVSDLGQAQAGEAPEPLEFMAPEEVALAPVSDAQEDGSAPAPAFTMNHHSADPEPMVLDLNDQESSALTGGAKPSAGLPSGNAPAPTVALPPPLGVSGAAAGPSRPLPASSGPLPPQTPAATPPPAPPRPPAPAPPKLIMPPPPPAEAARASAPRAAVPRATAARPAFRPRKRALWRQIPRLALIGGVAVAGGVGAFLGIARLMTSAPVCTSVNPAKAEPGQTVVITGSGFGASVAENRVRFGDQPATVTAASKTQITVAVPQLVASQSPVTVETRAGRSNQLFVKVVPIPVIAGLEPDVALPGEIVVIKGRNLTSGTLLVHVNHIPAEVVEPKPTALRVRVPEMPVIFGQEVPIAVQVGEETAKPASLTLGRLPMLLEIAPNRALAGERLTLKGRGFATEAAANEVLFGDQRALVAAAAPTQLTVLAPGAAQPASQVDTTVTATLRGSVSNPLPFTLVRMSSGLFMPRYFPAAAPEHPGHDHVFVSTDIGPALLLSDKAGQASTVERAASLAQALTALAIASVESAVAFEVRETPTGCVAVVGRAPCLVTATALDAAGYAESWVPGIKVTAPAPKRLAACWRALLQDQLTLFCQHQRPTQVAELSSRGRWLLEIYAEGLRQTGPGGGVPVRTVFPPSSAQAKGLRELALAMPAEGAGQTAVTAVEGIWRGTLDMDNEKRSLTLVLRGEGLRLAGGVSTKQGGLSIETPLREASYDKGHLQILVMLGNIPCTLKGTLSGASLTGTVHRQGPNSPASGTFSLQIAN